MPTLDERFAAARDELQDRLAAIELPSSHRAAGQRRHTAAVAAAALAIAGGVGVVAIVNNRSTSAPAANPTEVSTDATARTVGAQLPPAVWPSAVTSGCLADTDAARIAYQRTVAIIEGLHWDVRPASVPSSGESTPFDPPTRLFESFLDDDGRQLYIGITTGLDLDALARSRSGADLLADDGSTRIYQGTDGPEATAIELFSNGMAIYVRSSLSPNPAAGQATTPRPLSDLIQFGKAMVEGHWTLSGNSRTAADDQIIAAGCGAMDPRIAPVSTLATP